MDWKNRKINYQKLQYTARLATEYLNYALYSNDYPLPKLTERSRALKPIGLGFMGLASVFVRMGYRYGDENSKQLTKEFVEEIMYNTIKQSHDLVPLMGKFRNYSKSTYAKGEFAFTNDKYHDEIKTLLKEGIVNERLMAIAPTGSIALIAAAVSSEAASVSGGVEPIFALSYMRQVNPNSKDAYLIPQYDISILPTLMDLGYSKKEALEMIEKIGTKDEDEIFKSERFLTAQKLDYKAHMDILEIVSHGIDMSVSKTINVPNTATEEDIANIYLEFMERHIKGGTIYRDGSRQAILKEKKEEEKEKEDAKKLQVFVSDLSFNKKGKIQPKERPVLMEAIKKTLKFKENGKVKIFHIDVGFAKDAEPFEVFIRATQSSKEYTEMFNGLGRLISLAFRSNLSIDDTLSQVRKIKNWKNEYSEVASMIVDTIKEMIEVRKARGKKKEDLINTVNERKDWVRTAKGYFIDTEGKMRCPVCGGEVIAESGCYSCKNGDWNACS